MKKILYPYFFENQKCHGYFVTDENNKQKRACILLGHAWMGQNDHIKEMAHQFASLGYHAFALDMYGEGKFAKDSDEALQLMSYLLEDPIRIRKRIEKAIETVSSIENVEGCIFVGYCFGGSCAIEAVKGNLDLKGSVSVHGVLGNHFHLSIKERPFLKSKVPLLVLHGHDDPFVTTSDLDDFQKTMTEAGIDWQLMIFGHMQHGFTNPKSHFPERGIVYNKKAADRSLKYINNFIQEVL